MSWGLDMSTSPAKTAAVAIRWAKSGARVVEVRHPLKASAILELIAKHRDHSWAVDVPFGWPDLFVALMADRHKGPLATDALPVEADWEVWRTKQVAQRKTDAFLTTDRRIKTRPLPACFQMFGATAAMWALIESRLASKGVVIDRSGIDGSVCEAYPRAALAGWRFREKGKADLSTLRQLFPFLIVEPHLEAALSSDDVCDAVVCALVARARARKKTILPEGDDLDAARREGWIHVSTADPALMLD